jgi:hypothetical protein
MKWTGHMRKIHTETQYEVKTTCFYFSSCVGVFLGNKAIDRLKNLGAYAVSQSQIQLAYTIMEGG